VDLAGPIHGVLVASSGQIGRKAMAREDEKLQYDGWAMHSDVNYDTSLPHVMYI
jgi:hypothetical protein